MAIPKQEIIKEQIITEKETYIVTRHLTTNLWSLFKDDKRIGKPAQKHETIAKKIPDYNNKYWEAEEDVALSKEKKPKATKTNKKG